MYFKVDPSNGLPIYLQIIQQVKTSIAMGRLQVDEALPSVRQLAIDLAVNPNTVARAYLELEHEGIIFKRPGQGTFVSSQGVEMSKKERVKIYQEHLEKSLVEGIHLGLEVETMERVFKQSLDRIISARVSAQNRE
jgi:GntR family transcriptional regulator